MIQQRKCDVPPASLAKKKAYNGQDVQEQLFKDSDGKCYLCESHTYSNFEIEHLRGREPEELTYDWNNLFLSCCYCNGKKGNRFHDIPGPCQNPMELNLSILPHFDNGNIEISILGKEIPGIEQAQKLLSWIHNGTRPKMPTFKERQFKDRFMDAMMVFQTRLLAYRNEPTEDNKRAVLEQLGIKSEFLGAKFSMILHCTELFEEFEDAMTWNRQE